MRICLLISRYFAYRVYIPGNFRVVRESSMKEAIRWRDSSEKVMKFLFAHGFVAVDFRTGKDNYYLFAKDSFLQGKTRENIFE